MPGFLDTLQDIRVPFRKGSREGDYNVCCPFCIDKGETADTRFRLGVNILTGYGHCFNCEWRSREAPKWVLWKLGSDVPVDREEVKKEETVKEKIELPEDFQLLHKLKKWDIPEYYAKKYLLKRGFTVEDMKRYKFGVTLIKKYAYRIVMPVRWRGQLKGLVCRDFTGNADVRYLNTRGDKYLWNMPAFIKYGDLLVLSEGIFKAIAIEKAMGVHSAALLGHSITAQQLKQLKFAKASNILIWPDPGKPGVKGLISIANVLSGEGYKVSTIWPIPKKQADEYSLEAVKRIFSKRARLMDWGLTATIEASLSFGGQDED